MFFPPKQEYPDSVSSERGLLVRFLADSIILGDQEEVIPPCELKDFGIGCPLVDNFYYVVNVLINVPQRACDLHAEVFIDQKFHAASFVSSSTADWTSAFSTPIHSQTTSTRSFSAMKKS